MKELAVVARMAILLLVNALRTLTVVVGSLCAVAHAAAKNPIPYPHPQITEALFNVPTGAKGDANGDGERDAAGDEFIEIANPHNKPINLRGYTITNRLASPTEDTGKEPAAPGPESVGAVGLD